MSDESVDKSSPELKHNLEILFELYHVAGTIFPELQTVQMVSASELKKSGSYKPEEYPDIIPLLVMGHEFGHARHYILEFLSKKSESYNPRDEWYKNDREEANLLAIPDRELIPSRMTAAKMLPYFKAFRREWENIGIKTVQDLMLYQEKTYRETPTESYADNFAIKLISLILEDPSFAANLPYRSSSNS